MHRITTAALALLLAACGDTPDPPKTAAPTETGTTAGSEGPLNDQLSAKREAGMSKAPAEVKELMAKNQKELAETDLLAKALKTGANAPTFTLKDAMGQDMSLATLLEQGPVVVTFYRGKW